MTSEAVGLFFAEKIMAGPAEDEFPTESCELFRGSIPACEPELVGFFYIFLLYTSDAADERSSVDLGGRRVIKKKKTTLRRDERARQT